MPCTGFYTLKKLLATHPKNLINPGFFEEYQKKLANKLAMPLCMVYLFHISKTNRNKGDTMNSNTASAYEVAQAYLDGLRPFYNMYTKGGFAKLNGSELATCEHMLNQYFRVISDLASGRAVVI